MSGNTTANSEALRRAEVYSGIILDEIKDGFLPEGLHRDVSDFADGDTLNITTFGEVVLTDIEENEDIPVNAIDTGRITMVIDQYKGAGNYMTDKVRDDSWQAAQFDAAIPGKQLRAIKEAYETDLLNTSETMQVQGDANAINGLAHRFVASGTGGRLDLDDIIYAKLSLNKANIPSDGRICIVDSVSEATFDSLSNLVDVSNNPRFEGIVETGFAKNMHFLKNVYGFDIYVSNRLPHQSAENIDTTAISVPAPSGNGTSAADSVTIQFLSVIDEMTMPYMGAWRVMPTTEYFRNVQKGRDEFYQKARWGFGGQRTQSLATALVNATAY